MRQGVAIIGASVRCLTLIKYLEKFGNDGFVAGIYDLIPQRSQFIINEHNLAQAKVYDSLDGAVNDPGVGAVFVGTPDNAHVEPTLATLKAGRNVYCEKPLSSTLADCDTIISEAKRAKGVFYMGMNLRHAPFYEKMHGLVSSGRLGKVLTIEANEYYSGGRTFFRRWNRFRKISGGLWVTKACHDFDILNWFAGGNPRQVFAYSNLSLYKPIPNGGPYCRVCSIKDTCPDYYDTNKPENPLDDKLRTLTENATGHYRDVCLYNSEKDTFDNGIAILDYENDIRATYTLNVVSARTTRQLRLLGTKGMAEGDMDEGRISFWDRFTRERTDFNLAGHVDSSHFGADDKVYANFFRCCRTGEHPTTNWCDGRLAVKIGLAVRESADTGKPVKLR